MKKSYHEIVKYILKLESKIAFYPTVIGLIGLVFAVFMYYIEDLDISKYLLDHAPWLVINNVDTARTILTTFVAGLISIMVFSFSMVMILLSQASTNYSPRVLPGLISNRRHQIVLGVYLSCLLYCIFTLIAIEPTGDKYQLPGFSVLLSIIFMTLCLAAFIYFIHSISQEIQINNIMLAIFNKAKNRLNVVLDYEREKEVQFPDTSNWHLVNSNRIGYLEDIASKSLLEILDDNNAKAEVLVYKGQYLRKDAPLFKTNIELNEDCLEKLKDSFHFSRSELIESNYVLAYKQITEIAVKAMSPAINDPGTAINAIDYLTDLFILRMKKDDISFYLNESEEPIIYFHILKFNNILHFVMASLRTYCKSDVVVVRALVEMLGNLINNSNCKNVSYKDSVIKELENLFLDANESIENTNDIHYLESRIQEIKKIYAQSIL